MSSPERNQISIEPETPEERSERIIQEGREMYYAMEIGKRVLMGPLLGGSIDGRGSRREEDFARSHEDVLQRIHWQLTRPEEDIREDHALLGYPPEVVENLSPHKHVMDFLEGVRLGAFEDSNLSVLRGIRKVTLLYEQSCLSSQQGSQIGNADTEQFSRQEQSNTIVVMDAGLFRAMIGKGRMDA